MLSRLIIVLRANVPCKIIDVLYRIINVPCRMTDVALCSLSLLHFLVLV